MDVQEKHQLVASCMPPTRDPTCNPGMCPKWEQNHRPFGSQASTQSLSHTSQGSMHSFSFCLASFTQHKFEIYLLLEYHSSFFFYF